MMRFRYEAVSAAGELVAGEMEADTQQAVIERLQSQGHVPIRADAASRGALSRLLGREMTARKPRPARNLALLTQQLATLIHAGLSLDRALELAQSVTARAAERECLAEVLGKVRDAGFDEVILYFNVGLKPHTQVKDEMARFMTEVAPGF